MISSGCSLARAARALRSTPLASRTLRVSTIPDEAPVGLSPANSAGAVDADARVDNKPVGLPRCRAARRPIASVSRTHLIRFAPGPGAILRSRIDSDFSFGSLVRTTFTGRADPRLGAVACAPPGGGRQR